MDKKFTEAIGQWLNTPAENRDWEQGALFLFRLNGNKIMYRNVLARLNHKHDFIEYQIQKYYNFRVQELTHEQVNEMAAEVEQIVEKNLSLSKKADAKPHLGKRDDHDSLPDEIKAMYVENLSLLRRMRELHLRLRTLSLENSTCPDSERYPFLKELIALDKKMHKNWESYDNYKTDAQAEHS
ncbi:MAG: hypothetical protein NC217_07735 [Muribaculaceae bacterium]|nr:hypothetical protein [Muribaculaceae bacterium]